MMDKFIISKINDQLMRKTDKAIISLGCSFTAGQGAYSEEIYTKYGCSIRDKNYVYLNANEKQKEEIVSKFLDIKKDFHGNLNFLTHEYNNSFVSVLCNKYFKKEFVPINLGSPGSGNKAAIKELYYYPDIRWDLIKEIVVIFCPTGAERLDFVNDQFHCLNTSGRWSTFWPRDDGSSNGKKHLQKGYLECVFTEKYQILEQISVIQELLLWCNHKNAKLIIVPAFMDYYNRKTFYDNIKTLIKRNNDYEIVEKVLDHFNQEDVEPIINMWPWENMFAPGGYPTFLDLIMAQEVTKDRELRHFFDYYGKGTPRRWLTPCCHPSAKGHDLFARYLFNHIVNNYERL